MGGSENGGIWESGEGKPLSQVQRTFNSFLVSGAQVLLSTQASAAGRSPQRVHMIAHVWESGEEKPPEYR